MDANRGLENAALSLLKQASDKSRRLRETALADAADVLARADSAKRSASAAEADALRQGAQYLDAVAAATHSLLAALEEALQSEES